MADPDRSTLYRDLGGTLAVIGAAWVTVVATLAGVHWFLFFIGVDIAVTGFAMCVVGLARQRGGKRPVRSGPAAPSGSPGPADLATPVETPVPVPTPTPVETPVPTPPPPTPTPPPPTPTPPTPTPPTPTPPTPTPPPPATTAPTPAAFAAPPGGELQVTLDGIEPHPVEGGLVVELSITVHNPTGAVKHHRGFMWDVPGGLDVVHDQELFREVERYRTARPPLNPTLRPGVTTGWIVTGVPRSPAGGIGAFTLHFLEVGQAGYYVLHWGGGNRA